VHPWSRRAFTAVELMNFLALAAVLSAIGMYGLARYVRHTKTIEAVSSLSALANGAGEYFNASDANQPASASPSATHAMRHFPSSSTVPVPAEQDSVRGHRYQSNLADWSPSPWRDLRFSIVQPQCYRYAFEADGAGASAKATVTAEGDLDGDGFRSTFSLVVAPDQALAAQVSSTMTKKDAEE
jgi:Tfp pilus assembly protein FimT